MEIREERRRRGEKKVVLKSEWWCKSAITMTKKEKKKEANYLFVSVSHPSNEKKIAMTIFKLLTL